MTYREQIKNIISREILTPTEAAELLGVTKASMSNFKARGTVRPIKEAKGHALYLRSDIVALKESRRKDTASDAAANPCISISLSMLLGTSGETDDLLRLIETAPFLDGYAQLNEENKDVARKTFQTLIDLLLERQATETKEETP